MSKRNNPDWVANATDEEIADERARSVDTEDVLFIGGVGDGNVERVQKGQPQYQFWSSNLLHTDEVITFPLSYEATEPTVSNYTRHWFNVDGEMVSVFMEENLTVRQGFHMLIEGYGKILREE